MNIHDLPDELLLQMCEDWDTPTLLNMSETYSRVYQVCEKVRAKRREEYLRIDNLVKEILLAVQNNRVGVIKFVKNFNNGASAEISISKGLLEYFNLSQEIWPKDKASSIPWILPGSRFIGIGDFRIVSIDITKLRQLAKNLIDQDYVKS